MSTPAANVLSGPWDSDPVAGSVTPPGATASGALPSASSVAASGGAALPAPQTAASANAATPWENDPVAPDPADQPTSWGRAAGLDARSLMVGGAGLAQAASNAPRNLVNDVVTGVTHPSTLVPSWLGGSAPTTQPTPVYDTTSSNWAQDVARWADEIGLPRPRTPGERVSSAAVSALPSAVLAPEAPVAGMLSSAASGAASQEAAEQGYGPGGQLVAGLAAGGLPAIGAGGAALVRGVTRGGAEGAAAAAGRIADARAAGTTLTAGQATGSRTLQAIEGVSSKLWGGKPLESLVESQDQHVGASVRQIAENLAGDQEATPMTAGEVINAGAAAAKGQARAAERAAYSRVDDVVPPATPVNVSGTLGKLNELATPTPGAEATTGALIPKEISAMRDNLTADAGTAGTLPYSAVRALRTSIGNSIDWGFMPADPVKNGALKAVYGALSNDLNTAARATSPEAADAVSAANALHQANVAQSDILDNVVNKAGGPEAVYNAALSGAKTGATKVRAVMGALNPDQRNLFRATIIGKLGLVPASKQGATGEVFRLDSFLTHWNNLSPEAKDALFGASGPTNTVRRALDSVANTAADVREGTMFRNPSGTGGTVAHAYTLWDLLEGIGGAAFASHEGVGPEMIRNAALFGSGVAGNWGLAKLLTAPWFARWLATATKLPPSAVPAAIASLQRASAARKSRDGVNLASALQSAQNQPPPGAEVRNYRGSSYYLRPGTDRTKQANWVKFAAAQPALSKSGKPIVWIDGRAYYK